MAYRALLWKAGLVCCAVTAAACEDDPALIDGGDEDGGEHGGEHDSGVDAGGMRDLELSFEARVGSSVFDCAETYSAVGSSQATISLSDFRLYVSDVRLVGADDREVPLALTQGGEFQTADVALLDFEDRTGTCLNGTAETNTVIKGKLPEGSYKGLRFDVGVPSALNHADPLEQSSPLNLSALFWSWQLGHKFLRIDARVEAGNRPAFVAHLGSDGCKGNPGAGEEVTCARPNRATIDLASFDPETDKVVIDYGALVADVALDADQGGEKGCMAGATDPECQSIFGKLGLDPESGTPGKTAQTVFSAAAK